MTEIDRMRPRTLPWWRRLASALAPIPPDGAERLAAHYAAEIRLADAFARDAESLTRYPLTRGRLLEAAERAKGRAQRIRQALDEAGHPAPRGAPGTAFGSPMGRDGVRSSVWELGSMSEAYLADAYVMERWHPDLAELLHELQREAAADRRDLIWALAQITGPADTMTSGQGVAA